MVEWVTNGEGEHIGHEDGYRLRLAPRPGRCWWWGHAPGAIVQSSEGYAATIDQARADAEAWVAEHKAERAGKGHTRGARR